MTERKRTRKSEPPEEGITAQIKKSVKNRKPSKKVIPVMSTGIATLDLALDGGVPVGQITNIVGDSGSGKTYLACEMIFALKKALRDKLEIFYDDPEERFSFDTKELYGFDFMKPKQQNSETIEDMTYNLKKQLHNLPEGKTLVYVLDSFDELSSEAEKKRDEKKSDSNSDGESKGTYNLEKNRKFNEFFRLRKKEIRYKNCILIVISQVREKIGVTFGAKYYRTGGKALDHNAHVIMWLAESEKLFKKSLPYGVITRCKITKIGSPRPFRTCNIPIIFDRGADDVAGNILYLYDLYTETGRMKDKVEKGKIFDWDHQDFSYNGLIHYIEKHSLEKELSNRVKEKWDQIEESISSKGKRKERW